MWFNGKRMRASAKQWWKVCLIKKKKKIDFTQKKLGIKHRSSTEKKIISLT